MSYCNECGNYNQNNDCNFCHRNSDALEEFEAEDD